MVALELGGSVGGSMAGAAAPEILYGVTGGQLDITQVLPLRLLLTGLGGTAGHIIVSALHGIIGRHQVEDASENISSETWQSLRQVPSAREHDDQDK